MSAAEIPERLDDLDSVTATAFVTLGGELTLSEVLTLARDTLTKYVVFPSGEAADAVTLFAAATHVQHQLQFAARLNIRSPVKRCGKSRLFDLLALLAHKALVTVNISAAALVHGISEDDPPTIMLDEADATFSKSLKGDEKAEHLRGILNSGFDRGRPYTRYDIVTRRNQDCPTFAMAVLAGIGSLPDTIEDRSVIITLQRKAGHEKVAKYRLRRDKPFVKSVGERLHDVIAPYADKIADAEPEMPSGLNDRAEDVWEALIAVADHAGGAWPDRARRAARAIAGDAEVDGAESQRLLADLLDVFTVWADAGGERVRYDLREALHTKTILIELYKLPESLWADHHGKPLTDRGMANLLKDYKIKSRDVKLDGTNLKGYRREDLHDAWQRYLPPFRLACATSATSASSQASQVADTKRYALPALPEVAGSPGSPGSRSAGSPERYQSATDLSSKDAEVAQVAHTSPERDPAERASHVSAAVALVQRELGAKPVESSANGHHDPDCCPSCGDTFDSPVHAIACAGYDPAA